MSEITILIIEDELPIRRFLRTVLEAQHFKLLEAETGEQGLALAAQGKPHLILLDLGLPDQDGLEIIKRLREWNHTPIIILSARDQERDKVLALDLGADDYLAKPFGMAELLARIRVALRHHQTASEENPIFTCGKLKVDLATRKVMRDDQVITLTPIQYQLLTILVRNAGKVVTQQQLLREVWGPSHVGESDYVRIYIHQLRHKIEKDPARPEYLRTEPGVGYRLWSEDM